ncbi:MAG: 30S ribosome-binding factor RbfA [Planctomycetota bacterium]|jgi:ribosome-binding factor A
MSRRTERIAKVMQQAIGLILRKELADPRIDTARTSITRVEVQEDLMRAKVYVSVIGSEAQQRLALEALNHAAGRIQAELTGRISLRHTPVLEFLTDKRFKGAMQTWEIIRQAMDEIEQNRQRPDAAAEAEAADAGGENEPDPAREG